MLVHIERYKGKKDRYVKLPESILDELRNYYRATRPKILSKRHQSMKTTEIYAKVSARHIGKIKSPLDDL